jgi:hypothetical protein
VSCADFDSAGSSDQILGYIAGNFNTTEPYNWELNHLSRFINQSHGYRPDSWPRQPTPGTPELGLSGVCVYTQCRVGIGDYQCIGPSIFRGLSYKPNASNRR